MKFARALSVLSLVLVAGSCSSSGATRAAPAAPPFRPIAGDDGLLVWSAGRDRWLADPKDARLKDALGHWKERLAELPNETHKPDMPVDDIQLAIDALADPMCIRAGLDPKQQGLPFWANLRIAPGTRPRAVEMAQRIVALLTKLGVPAGSADARHGGLAQVALPNGVSVWHGVPSDQDAFVAQFGAHAAAAPDLGTLDLPAGVSPCMAMKLDFGQVVRAVEMSGEAKGAEALGLDAMRDVVVQMGMGAGDDRSYGALRLRNWKKAGAKLGTTIEGPLPRRALELVPADATVAMVSRIDPQSIVHAIRNAAKQMSESGHGLPPGTDPIDVIANMTGFDLEHDLLDHVGGSYGLYTSERTGGGGWWSGVAFLEVRDAKGFAAALDRLDGFVADLEDGVAEGRVHARHWKSKTRDVTTLSVPGLPIPAEISWALSKGWFVVALSPQAIVGALDQIDEPKSSILDRPEIAAQHGLERAVSLSFVDVPHFVRDGYFAASMLGSAVSNAMSSPAAPDRVEPGVTPTYAELVKGARPLVALGRIEGDDFVTSWETDRSMLVNVAGVVGAMGPAPYLIGAIAAAAGGKQSRHVAPSEEAIEMHPETDEMGSDEMGTDEMGSDEPVPAPAPDETKPHELKPDPK